MMIKKLKNMDGFDIFIVGIHFLNLYPVLYEVKKVDKQ